MDNSALGDGLGSGSDAPHPRHSVNVFQALGLLCMFALLAGIGGLLTAGLIIPIAAGASTVANGTTKAFDEIPTELEPGELSEASYIYASDGTTLLARTYVENRVVVPLDKISINIQNAVIATEDKRFYSHGGIDPEGMGRAVLVNLQGGKQGGSTLTQQYVKNVLIEKASTAGDAAGVKAAKEATLERKLKEAKLAIALEKRMTKDEILTNYLNIAQFGASVNGVETAANHYFGVTAADLTVIQAATIAGITAAPNKFDPVTNPAESQGRRNLVLQRMYDQGYVSKEEYTAARATPLVDTLNVQPLTQGCAGAGGSAYFCDYVTKVLIQDPVFGETVEDRKKLLYRGGLRVVTTLDLAKQAIADTEINAAVPADNQYGFAAAMSVVEPRTGKILAMSQDRTYSTAPSPPAGSTSVNYNTDYAHGGSGGFQPGSTFKAFILAEWINEGNTLLESVSADKRNWNGKKDFTKTSCVSFNGATWEPGNADGKGTGQRSVLQATALSINTAFATMSSKIDLCGAAELASQIGFRPATTTEKPGGKYVSGVEMNIGMALGTQETYPVAMANSYATFASGGIHCEPIAITSVSRDGVELPVPQANCRQVLETSTVTAVNYALQQVISPNGGAKGNALTNHTAAGKTGTTQSNSNVWFVGYTPALSTAMWMGHPDNPKILLRDVWIAGKKHPIVWGSTIAAPTWKRFMDQALAGTPDIPFEAPGQKQIGTPPAPTPTPAPAAPAPSPAAPAPTEGQPTATGQGNGQGRNGR